MYHKILLAYFMQRYVYAMMTCVSINIYAYIKSNDLCDICIKLMILLSKSSSVKQTWQKQWSYQVIYSALLIHLSLFSPNNLWKTPIAHPLGWGMIVFHSLTEDLSSNLLCYVQYRVSLYNNIYQQSIVLYFVVTPVSEHGLILHGITCILMTTITEY